MSAVDTGRARAVLAGGTPTAVGSLPHGDAAVAAGVALSLQPELPAAPSLPRRSPLEGMLAQVAIGMGGVSVAPDGALVVDRRRLSPPSEGVGLDGEAWRSTRTFLRAAGDQGRTGPIKLQVTGPITLGLALVAAGAKPARAFATAGVTIRRRVKALLAEAAVALPTSPVVLVIDEPGLTAIGDASYPLGADETIDLLSGALATAGSDVVAGIHCCGPTDWRLVLQAGPDLLSMPVGDRVTADAVSLGAFLERGGWIAWGAVPTDRPLGDRDDVHWRRLTGLWCDLAREGCDPRLLRAQALITPACGLALHHPGQVEPVYRLVRHLAERVQDQALAARMSAGA